MKYCRKCKTSYPFAAFSKNVRLGDGLHYQCKSCQLAAVKLSQAKRREGGEEYLRTVARQLNPHWKIPDLPNHPQMWKL